MSRGFVSHYEGLEVPKRATKCSAGYDFFLPETIVIPAFSKVVINTYIASYMEEDEFLSLHIRSSIAIKKGIILTNQVGIIDSDYYQNPDNGGIIFVVLTNTTSMDVTLNKGEKFVQGIFQKYLKASDDQVDQIRKGGIGSTSK